MKKKLTPAESWAELARLQRLRSDLEGELENKRLTPDERAALEVELARTRGAIRYVR